MDNLQPAERQSLDPGASPGAVALSQRRSWLASARTGERLKIGAVFVVLCLLSMGVLLPIWWMVSTSLKVDAQIFTNPPSWFPSPLQWHNYADALTNFDFGTYLRNTLTITIPAV